MALVNGANIPTECAVVTPSDNVILNGGPWTYLYVGGGGNVVASLRDTPGVKTTFYSMSAGVSYPIFLQQIYSTGTTAANLVLLG